MHGSQRSQATGSHVAGRHSVLAGPPTCCPLTCTPLQGSHQILIGGVVTGRWPPAWACLATGLRLGSAWSAVSECPEDCRLAPPEGRVEGCHAAAHLPVAYSSSHAAAVVVNVLAAGCLCGGQRLRRLLRSKRSGGRDAFHHPFKPRPSRHGRPYRWSIDAQSCQDDRRQRCQA